MWGVDAVEREQLLSYRQLVVGFSGGLDSTVLLHILSSDVVLSKKLHAVHIHHGLSPHADAWQASCHAFCLKHNIKFTSQSITFNTTSNLEALARDARRAVFYDVVNTSDCLLLAHHQDDQAETLLLNLLRGAGIDGLAAMPALTAFGQGYLARPLLNQTREALKRYAEQHDLVWINDESNQNTDFSRNYLRHDILPRLQSRWPGAVKSITQCAQHAQAAKQSLDDLAYLDCPALLLNKPSLALDALYNLSRARLAHVVRVWLKQQGMQAPETRVLDALINQVIFARLDAVPCMRLNGLEIRRYRNALYILRESTEACLPTITQEFLTSKNICVTPGSQITVSFRRGGESMVWRGYTRSLKYVFQTLGVPPWLRDRIPLIFIDNHLAAVLDFAVADAYVKEDVYDTV